MSKTNEVTLVILNRKAAARKSAIDSMEISARIPMGYAELLMVHDRLAQALSADLTGWLLHKWNLVKPLRPLLRERIATQRKRNACIKKNTKR